MKLWIPRWIPKIAFVKDRKMAKFEDQRKDKFRKWLDVETANDEKEKAKYVLQLEQLEWEQKRRMWEDLGGSHDLPKS